MLSLLLIPLAASLAFLTYLRLEPGAGRTWVPMLFRAVAWGGLGALLANPGCPGPTDTRSPVVLLDGSLSMRSAPGLWRAARDTARALGRVRWFGDGRPWTDSTAQRGRSDLGSALAAAAATGRRIVVVTDGELGDVAEIQPDLLASAGVILLPRPRGRDLAITQVSGPGRATVGDSLSISADVRLLGSDAPDSAAVTLTLGTRVLARTKVRLAPGATVQVRLAAGTRGIPAGIHLLRVGIVAAADAEPRDDSRLVAVDLAATPGIVMLANPGDWDARFLYRTLREVADLPVKGYVRLEPDRWREMDGLREVGSATVRAASKGADLLVIRGDAQGLDAMSAARGLLRWPGDGPGAGEWYVAGTPTSPIAMAFLGVPLDSLPPVVGALALVSGAGDWIGLTAQSGRRGAARPVLVGRQLGRRREVMVGADGFWRWGFRGGPSEDAYRALVAATVSWLLAAPDAGAAAARPVRPVVEQGVPLVFERAHDSTAALAVALEGPGGARLDTLRFGGDGLALLWLPPGSYRYRLAGPRGAVGTVAVDAWSREWLAEPVAVRAHDGQAAGAGERRSLRELPWLYALVLLALAAEWLARRRLGLR
jgi:hypothetical protein